MHRTLQWLSDPQGPLLLRASRWRMTADGGWHGAHDHEFCEVFWVEKGQGIHEVNGEKQVVNEGDMVFVRNTDAHSFANDSGQEWGWMNVTFSMEAERSLRRRYSKELPAWPWRRGGQPHVAHVSRSECRRLSEQVALLPNTVTRWLDLDWMFTAILRAFAPVAWGAEAPHLPEWLSNAVASLEEPELLIQGPAAFVERTLRCREHVNRTIQTHFGMTTVAFVRHHQLEYAARQLRLTDKDILSVASDSGFDNISYFYRCFQKQYGMTPKLYRR